MVTTPAALSPAAAEQLDRLYRKHHNRVIAYVQRNGADLPQAEDIASEMWVTLASQISRKGLALADGPGLTKLLAMQARRAVSAHWAGQNRELPVAFPQPPPAEEEADYEQEPYDRPKSPVRLRPALDHLPHAAADAANQEFLLTWVGAGEEMLPVERPDWHGAADGGSAVARIDNQTHLHYDVDSRRLTGNARCPHNQIHQRHITHPTDLEQTQLDAAQCPGHGGKTAR
ncbi:sigma-70 RNA polymerase sigma factor region 4 domain-containing protein [Streptomyces aculeolatus]